MKKFGLLFISILGLTACSGNTTSVLFEQTFTVIWQNFDGTILEKDVDVKFGSLPSYDGATPVREGKANYTYEFKGWSPELIEVTHNVTYTATYNKVTSTDDEAYNPVLSSDGKTITYGLYPQSVVKDETLLTSLESLSPTGVNDWCFFEDNYYVKKTSNVYNNESYTFNDGSAIEQNKEYWFKCEPISWNVLSNDNGKYYAISSTLLDVHNFYSDYQTRTLNGETILPNNYLHSDVREYLNNEFLETAFTLNNSFLKANSDKDKVSLPSKEDMLNTQYGFENNEDAKSKTRECKSSEYTRSVGSWVSKETAYKNNGTYWTKSSSDEFDYASIVVNAGGYLSNYAVDGTSHSIRPCITIEL